MADRAPKKEGRFFVAPVRINDYVQKSAEPVPVHVRVTQPNVDARIGFHKLHRTLRRDITFGKLFLLPFQRQRPWRLPNKKVPERAPKPTDELAL